jgi:diguanylate cyclase (GGDEF)-like protein/PAS domain S-box-containing protein
MGWGRGWLTRVPAPAFAFAALVAAHALYLAVGLPGGRTLSDALFVAVPALGTVACARAARRLTGRARACWGLLAGVELAWLGANVVWAWYELVLDRQVPTPSPADWLYSLALVLAVTAVVTGILPLVHGRSGAQRALLDVFLVGGALLFLAWVTVLAPLVDDRQASFTATITWLYPALGVTASTVAMATMTRVHARARLPWLLLGGAFVVGAGVDAVWAWANVNGGFAAGGMLDPLWVVAYGTVGISALFVRGDAGLRGTVRLAPTRWESLGAYVPVSLAVLAAFVQQVRGVLTDSSFTFGILLVAVLVLRQVLAILENLRLAQTLEARVTDSTAGLRASEEHFRSIVASISDVVVILGDDLVVRYQSPAAEKPLGYGPDEMVGMAIDTLVHPEDLAAAQRASAELAGRAGRAETYVARMLHRSGTWRHMEATVTDLLDHPSVQGIVLALRDVGDRVELEDRLRHQAFHDGLTGLANRALLYDELGRLLAADRRPTLLLLDLDEFKAVNDTAGHDLGDDVLVAVAGRLIDSTRPGDLVSRLGGDEFAIVLHDDPRAQAGVAVAERILQALRMPLVVQGRQVRCLGSIGVAAADDLATPAGLLRDADTAMYVAKAKGKGRIERFTPTMRDDVVRRQRIEELLRRAVVDRRLELHFQPLVDLAMDEFAGAEALLRLRGDGELISPVEFIPVAEETGMIVEIGAWVLTEACRHAAGWQALRPDGPPFDVAVNVSTRQLQEPGLARAVAAALEIADLSPSLLTLEITEGSLASDDPAVDETLLALRKLGVRLSIDDFGAGWSSLGRLQHVVVDELKIDRSFVADLSMPITDAPLVDAILAMARRLGLTVVAEGIETAEQAAYLRARSDRGQGYLYSRPLPGDEVTAVLAGEPGLERVRR